MKSAEVVYRKYSCESENKKGEEMRAIFITWVVDPKKCEVLHEIKTIAKDTQEAERKALMGVQLDGDIDNYDIHTEELSDKFIRAKKDVQKVKVVKDD